MPATTRKRQRVTLAAVQEKVLASSASSLASRVDARATPCFWRHAASSAGIAGADNFLVHLGRSISAAMQSVADAAEAARAQLRETRAALHAAVDERCDNLMACIDSSEATKVACLERELIAVDAALERWRSDTGAVREAISSLSNAELGVQHTALSSRLDTMEAQLQALPTAVLEPPFVGLHTDAPALLSSIAGFGHVLAPLSVTATDLTLEDMSTSVARRGALRLRLSLGARHAAQTAEAMEVSMGRLVEATIIEATLEGPETEPLPLQVIIVPDVAQHCFAVSLRVPALATSGMSLLIAAVNVAGQSLPGLPLRLRLHRGIAAPLKLKFVVGRDLCISPDGQVYCPSKDRKNVLVFDADGSPLPEISCAGLGLKNGIAWATYAHGDTASLLLADGCLGLSCLVAVDPATRAVRWKSAAEDSLGSHGIVALPSQGVVIVCSVRPGGLVYSNGCLSAYRLSDGSRALAASDSILVPGLDYYIAADPASGAVFASVCSGFHLQARRVVAFYCITGDSGIRLTWHGPVAAAGIMEGFRPLTVIPPAAGKTVSHLVVGAESSPELRVLSLPGLVLEHTHRLEGMRVIGLAADPWGGALAVCDAASQAVHVLAWPLPGMSPLQ